MTNITIQPATTNDIAALYAVAAAMRDVHEARYFERCLDEQAAGNRIVLLARAGADVVGYVQLNFRPTYTPFLRLSIPEVQDLNIIPAARQQGLGAQLVAACESLVQERGMTDIGISVGLYPRYGAAQRLYIKRGYVPDGAGVCYDDIPAAPGEMRAVDDLLTLKLIKDLSK
ncbi:MAG: GNAT family N-acetyltransferase [Micavibrio sp.]|nr:GNAT family N-acetyltransferase [Micavibrio sp.]